MYRYDSIVKLLSVHFHFKICYSTSVQLTKMSESNIPLPSPGATGVTPDGTATATCYCGAVQLSFVSPSLEHSRIKKFLTLKLTFRTARRGRRLGHFFRLQLQRLPQNHRVDVRFKLHHQRQKSQAPSRGRQTNQIRAKQDHCHGQRHGE